MSKNFADSTVATAPSPATSGTSVTVASGHGTKFYNGKAFIAPASGRPTPTTAEVVTITNIVGDVLTITRNTEAGTARTVVVGDLIYQGLTAAMMDGMATTLVSGEIPGGLVNSSNTVFTTSSPLATGSLKVFRNGIRLKAGGADFTEGAQGFTMVTAPTTGAVLLVDYNVQNTTFAVGTNSTLTDETPSGSVNSSNTSFSAARAYIAGSLEVYLGGIKQRRGTDFTETTPTSGVFTMTTAPTTGQSIRINYLFNLNPSSNADTVDGIHASTTPTANQLLALNSRAQSGEWWEELGRTTLAVAGNTISVPSFTAKKYLRVRVAVSATGGTVDASVRFNNDTASNYAYRASTNGGADATAVSQTNIQLTGAAAYTMLSFEGNIANLAVAEKNMVGFRGGNFSAAGAATAPDRAEIAGKWANTSAQISRVDVLNLAGTGNFAIGSELIILGHD